MKSAQYTRRTLPAEQRDYVQWPEVEVSAMDEHAAERFSQLRMALTEYLDGSKLIDVCATYHVTRSELLRRLNRCVGMAPDGRMWGWRALISGLHVAFNRRIKPARPTNSTGRGLAGAFDQLLTEHPAIERALIDKILKVRRRGEIHELRIDGKQLHIFFLTLCSKEGISITQYPYNTKAQGRRAIQRLVRKVIEKHLTRGVAARYGHDAAHRMRVGTGHLPNLLAKTIFDAVQIDEHQLHMVGVIGVPTPHGIQRVPIERISLILVVDVASSAVLGYAVAIRRAPKAIEFLAAVNCALEIWKPCALTIPGLSYPEGAGFPSALIPELSGCAWAMMQLDNALMHYANAVIDRVRRHVGCAINFGPVGSPERRPVVERIFKALEQRGFQRLPSSTGSNAGDPLINNPNRAAVQHCIDIGEVLQLIDIEIAISNNEPGEGISQKTPLEMLRDIASDSDGHFLARHLPPCSVRQPPLSIVIVRRRVGGSLKEGRRPYIELDRVRYTSDILANAPELIDEEFILHVDEQEFRTVRAFRANGSEFGVLRAMGKWGRTPHTREMRRHINSLKDHGKIMIGPDDDPIPIFLKYLTDKAAQDAARSSPSAPHTSQAGTQLARVAQTAKQPLPEPVQDTPQPSSAGEPSSTLRAAPRNISVVHRAFSHR